MNTDYAKMNIEERLASFATKRIGHPLMMEMLGQLQTLVQNPAGVNIGLLCGPTGVGKTTMLDVLVDRINRGELPAMNANPGCMPVVCVKAPAPKGPNFSWKDFYVRVLDAMDEPQIEHKIATLDPKDLKNARGNHTTLNVDELSRIAERALRFRETKLLMIDEAQHLHRVTTGRRLLDQLDVLKSLSNEGKLIILLTGTYDLVNMFELNGQLLRRTSIFNYSRYKFDSDHEKFLVALKAFQSRLPLDEPADLLTHSTYLYECSLGLVGILKNHLDRALKHALTRKADTIELKDLEQSALSSAARWKILQEANAGDRFFDSMTQTDKNIKAALGIAPMSEQPKDDAQSEQKRIRLRKILTRPGMRKTINDPVGVEDLG